MISFTIFGKPLPQGRPRAFVPRGSRRVMVYDPPTSKEWKNAIRLQSAQHKPKELMLDALRVVLNFYLPRPKTLPKKVYHHTKRPDIDNLTKACFDAFEGIFYKNDTQIIKLEASKHYCTTPQEQPRVEVRIFEQKEIDYEIK